MMRKIEVEKKREVLENLLSVEPIIHADIHIIKSLTNPKSNGMLD